MEFEFNQLFYAFLLTLFAGFSTSIGAVIAFFSKKDDYRLLSIGLGFSAGVMIYISFMEILPDSMGEFARVFENKNAELIGLLAFFGGIVLTALIDKFIPSDLNPHEPKDSLDELKFCPLPSQNEPRPIYHPGISNSGLKRLKRTGVITAFAITLHNFPEGFATFISGVESFSFGVVIAIAVALHNIPEGLAVSLPIYHATGDKKRAFIYSCLSGLAEPVGAVVSALILMPFLNDIVLAVVFGVVAGIMVFISFDELLPAARSYDKAHDSLYGLVGGMAVMAVSLILLGI
ncbi:MAG: zinc transporter ZupT [Campylobacter sp.]|uniref:zinc transporter ZupT n=1 Tax=Campylobacter sp. TaxID=205 RepID=UPI001B0E36B3|nr:zinc transporter ZupT [Campylobacter sp.]MBO5063914.1 zinc transporter ZupT [Campylobacter sp.]